MKDQQSYFEKADFQSDLPLQLLTAALGLTFVLLELAVAQWADLLRISAEPVVNFNLLHDHLSQQIYADFHDVFVGSHW